MALSEAEVLLERITYNCVAEKALNKLSVVKVFLNGLSVKKEVELSGASD